MLSTQFSPCCEALYRVSLKYLDNVRSTMDYVKIRKKLRYPFHSTMFYQAAVREREKNEAFRRSNFHHSSMHYEKIERTRCKRFTRRTKEHSTLVDLSDHAKAQCTRSMAETRGKRRKKRAEREKKKKKRERTSFRKRIAKRNCHSRDAEAGNRNGSLGTRSTDSRIARDPLGDGKTDQRRSNASHWTHRATLESLEPADIKEGSMRRASLSP